MDSIKLKTKQMTTDFPLESGSHLKVHLGGWGWAAG